MEQGGDGRSVISPDCAEIRVLGPLRVRRTDGSRVDPRAWRTGKTADLLRLLAVHSREAVPVATLLDALWPNVDEEHGRASLRTAVAQIRRVLGQDSIERRLGGLLLRDVWVDAAAFVSLAREARRLATAKQPARLVSVAWEAEALHLGEFRAHNHHADWALRERDALSGARRAMLLDAAEAAIELGWMREAIEFAAESLVLDPCSERASRALMQGYAGAGETSRALREYERCRAALAEELGVDPSASTRAVHLQLLSPGATTTPVGSALIGRDEICDRVRTAIEDAIAVRRPTVIAVAGMFGSGKTRLIEEAGAAISAKTVRVPAGDAGRGGLDCVEGLAKALGLAPAARGCDHLARAVGASEPVLVVVDDAELVQAASLRRLHTLLGPLQGPVVVVLDGVTSEVEQVCTELAGEDGAPGERRLVQVAVPPMTAQDLTRLARALLVGEPLPPLLDVLLAEANGLPGRLVATVRAWLRDGRVAVTAEGLVYLPEGRQRPTGETAHRSLAPLLDRLGEDDLEVVGLMAVLRAPATPALVGPLLREATGAKGERRLSREVQATFDRLVDLSVLASQASGYAFRDPLLCDAVRSWLRPSERQELHRRIAERAHISSEQRVEHWLSAGEPLLARAAALEASAEAIANGRYEAARAQLMEACSLGGMIDAPPESRVELHERLGDVCAELELAAEARAAYAVAASVCRARELPQLARITAKSEALQADVATDPDSAPRLTALRERAEPDPALAFGLELDATSWADEGLEPRLRAQLEEADRQGDSPASAQARLHLAAVLFPRRDFEGSRLYAREAMDLTVIPVLRARAILEFWLPGVLLGHAALAEGPLTHARELADDSGDRALAARLNALAVLLAHDLGRPEVDDLLQAAGSNDALAEDEYWSWVPIRVATERGVLQAALLADALPVPDTAAPIVRQMRAITSATLRAELGQVPEAIGLLRTAVEEATAGGAVLLLPEAVARLIALEAATDLSAAKEHFELLDWSAAGDHRFPRENCLRLLARAAVRAASGQFDAAAVAAANAADVAEDSALPLLAAHAHRVRAGQLSSAGRWSEARMAEAAASRCRRTAGLRTSAPGASDRSQQIHRESALTRSWTVRAPRPAVRGETVG